MAETPADLIRRHLPVAPVPSLPDIRLHLAGPRSRLGHLLAAGRDGADPPYWAHLWAGGLVLASYLHEHPAAVIDRRVLDLGCGSGLVAIAAGRSGARSVEAVDVDPHAAVATGLNAALNGVAVAVRCADILDAPVPDVDLVLVGDLFYDAALADRVAAFLTRCKATGAAVLVGDPGRAALPLGRLTPVYRAATRDFGTGPTEIPSTVYRFEDL